ncbi:MAG: hypothetical protein LBT92_00895 [Rickettsiales bacterium]|nr:hypothetical protein [Rickettsiales bacterium]
MFKSRLAGFFYARAKGILHVWMTIVVVGSFLNIFSKKIIAYRELAFTMSPIEVMSIELMNSIAVMMLELFLPVLLVVSAVKVLIARRYGVYLPQKLRDGTKYRLRVSLLLGGLLGLWFFAYTNTFAGSAGLGILLRSSAEVAVMLFACSFLTFAMLAGLMHGFSPILSLKARRK